MKPEIPAVVKQKEFVWLPPDKFLQSPRAHHVNTGSRLCRHGRRPERM